MPRNARTSRLGTVITVPRQRMIKPEFFDSESLGMCSVGARMAFVGLWVMGDDYGNQKAQISRLRLRIFPYDEITDDEFLGYLCELEEVGCIKGYEVGGERYITTPNFSTYQTVRKPSKSAVPTPPESVEKRKKTTVIHEWRTSTAPERHSCSSSDGDAPVTHHDATSDPEVMNEGSNFFLRKKIAKEMHASGGADAVETAPPSMQCPNCDADLKPTDSHKGDRQLFLCPLCAEEVWL